MSCILPFLLHSIARRITTNTRVTGRVPSNQTLVTSGMRPARRAKHGSPSQLAPLPTGGATMPAGGATMPAGGATRPAGGATGASSAPHHSPAERPSRLFLPEPLAARTTHSTSSSSLCPREALPASTIHQTSGEEAEWPSSSVYPLVESVAA